jgi:multicomponent Na+:H+ antiporter subunit B
MKTYKKKPVIVRSAADFFLPLACVYGAYVVLHGHLSPGGGFQGGVLIASAILMVFLGYGSLKVKKTFNDHKMHSSETVAEILYLVMGLLGILGGFNFCVNFVFEGLNFDTSVLMNHAVGYHVMGGIICLLAMMLSLLDHNSDDTHEKKEGEA